MACHGVIHCPVQFRAYSALPGEDPVLAFTSCTVTPGTSKTLCGFTEVDRPGVYLVSVNASTPNPMKMHRAKDGVQEVLRDFIGDDVILEIRRAEPALPGYSRPAAAQA